MTKDIIDLLKEYQDHLISTEKDFPVVRPTIFNALLVKRQQIQAQTRRSKIEKISQIIKKINEDT